MRYSYEPHSPWVSAVKRHTSCSPLNNNLLRLALQPIAYSDRDLADVFYSGAEVVPFPHIVLHQGSPRSGDLIMCQISCNSWLMAIKSHESK